MKNKSSYVISSILSERQGAFTESFTIFFQMQEKPETCQDSNLTYFIWLSFGDDINLTFAS